MKSVTVVIPVYKDWNTLEKCLGSLKKYLDCRHKVVIVNDMGPDWELMETKISESIIGFENFYYDRNLQNMGFVKTCNRAVKELDTTDNDVLLLNSDTEVTEGFLEEMLDVLYLYEKHGVVCPRSNNATILTMPVKNNMGKLLDEKVSYSVFCQMKDKLPRFSIIPTGVGFAFLIKRELIDKFGLFDEKYGLGYNEENDFCMRINQYGYNVVMSNRSYVYHFESKSFGDAKNELDINNRKTLIKRYPYYDSIVQKYFNHNIDPIEYFADLIVDSVYEKKRILFSLYEVPAAYNGTAQYGLTIFNEFYKLYNRKYDIHVLINDAADKLFGLSEEFPNVWYPYNITGTFHLAFSPSQIIHIEHLFLLNRVSLKYVFCMQDVISIRSNYILVDDYERLDIFRKSIQYCAAMTSISQFSLDDTIGYFHKEFEEREINVKVIYHGVNEEEVATSDDEIPFDDYYMVFGNFYKHKFLKETLPYLKEINKNFIILGSSESGSINTNIYGYKSGRLSDGFISLLVNNAKAILFPSVYEGFGLPILDGIKYDKKVIATNNELNRELKKAFDNFSDNIFLFDKLEDLKDVIAEVDKSPVPVYKNGKKEVRTWKTVAEELEKFLEEVLKTDVDNNILKRRWEDMRYIEDVHRMYVVSKKVNSEGSKYYRFKRYLENNHPKIYIFLRKIKGGF
ncbi:hypothetical protein C804_05408 [Lachnospiraceae bacterium A4]|nr:hypothetical protein C804_05408 [Lachnospiraceae bacterium A4]